jgi:mannose/cellobiose epimerase-like protein (N-acyl-D-glucosamine 2-epimerase family)
MTATPPGPGSSGHPGDPDRLAGETARLLRFAAGSRHPAGGFGWQDDAGRITPDQPVELWITGRMTHVFGLAVLEGHTEYAALLEHGVEALELMRDRRYGGWHERLSPAGPLPGPKTAYPHSFVVLAAATATAAGHPRGPGLLDDALEVMTSRFLGPDGLAVEEWDETFTHLDGYRGVNANMHTVEALLAAGEATGDAAWYERARVITERILHEFAAGNGWRIPEHFDTEWRPRFEFNRDHPDDPFRPYGSTVGHGLEWARLALHLRLALGSAAPSWLLDAARELFRVAVQDGWDRDGETGLIYTVDWQGEPVVHERMHWVVAEGVATAAVLHAVAGETGDVAGQRACREWYERWWEWIEAHLIDRDLGSWHHELDRHNRPSSTVWKGKPDAYHAVQATIIPRRPMAVSVAGSLRPAPATGRR